MLWGVAEEGKVRCLAQVRTTISLSDQLVKKVDQIAGDRGRSAFIEEAVERYLRILEFRDALGEAFGVWSDERHRDLQTQDDIVKYKRQLRSGTNERVAERLVDE